MNVNARQLRRMIVNNDDFGVVVNCAVRYSLGRRTYEPSLVTDWIKEYCRDGVLSRRCLAVLKRDIEEHGRNGDNAYGDPCDITTWKQFLKWVNKELSAYDEEKTDGV